MRHVLFLVVTLCAALLAQGAWYWPFGSKEDDPSKPLRLHRLLEEANNYIEIAEDEALKGNGETALENYRLALGELDRVERENPGRAETAEFSPLRNKRAACVAAMDAIRFAQVNDNERAVSVTDTRELQKKWNKKHGIKEPEEEQSAAKAKDVQDKTDDTANSEAKAKDSQDLKEKGDKENKDSKEPKGDKVAQDNKANQDDQSSKHTPDIADIRVAEPPPKQERPVENTPPKAEEPPAVATEAAAPQPSEPKPPETKAPESKQPESKPSEPKPTASRPPAPVAGTPSASDFKYRLKTALAEVRNKDYIAADLLLEDLMQEKPDDLNVLLLKAAAQTGMGSNYAARRTLEKAMRTHPKSYLPYYNLANLVLQMGESVEAARQYYEMGRLVGGPPSAALEKLLKGEK